MFLFPPNAFESSTCLAGWLFTSTFITNSFLTFSYHPQCSLASKISSTTSGIMLLHKQTSLIYISILSKTVWQNKPYIAAGILAPTIVCYSKKMYMSEDFAQRLCLRVLLTPKISLHSWTASWSPCLWSYVSLLYNILNLQSTYINSFSKWSSRRIWEWSDIQKLVAVIEPNKE